MQRFLLALVLAASSAVPAHAQDKPIQDNSFFIEEAYNQEPGVVQHILKYHRPRSRDWTFTFTQEWPFGSQKHQVSYSVPAQRAGEHTGLGDVALDYRYQAIGDGDAPLAVAPRVSLVLPTGDERKELGAGGTGFQLNLPASMVLSQRVVTHFNAGATITPGARNADGASARTTDYNLGQSFVWLLRPRLNLLLETLWSSEERGRRGRDLAPPLAFHQPGRALGLQPRRRPAGGARHRRADRRRPVAPRLRHLPLPQL